MTLVNSIVRPALIREYIVATKLIMENAKGKLCFREDFKYFPVPIQRRLEAPTSDGRFIGLHSV